MKSRWVPQERWALQHTDRMPAPVGAEMLRQHGELVGTVGPVSTSPYYVANQFLQAQHKKLLKSRIWDAYDEDAVRDYAENYARACAVMPMLTQRELYAEYRGVRPPERKPFLSHRYEACAARLADPLWWRRQLRKEWTRASENGVRELGIVRKGRAPYASDEAVNFRAAMKRRMRRYQENSVAVNELGEQLSLFDVAQKSIANPALRRGEFMTRVRGFEELANFRKDVALFFTLTTPTHFHAQLASGGKNPKFDPKQTVRDAQAWLCKMWARARAKLHRLKVTLYGFRIAEPHHDGTPHWHGLFFVRRQQADVVSAVIGQQWLKEFGDDPGARLHRVTVQKIDQSKGSAVGYIAKYVSKNIDGAGAVGAAESDETGEKVSDSVQRVDAWAALHGIRQFQQLGGPPVGLWREARRLREEVDDVDIERARRQADRGSVYGFCRCVGGDVGSRRTSLKLWKEETGELTKYGEPCAARIVGLRFASAHVITRPHRWKIERKGRSCNTGKGDVKGDTGRSSVVPVASGSFSESLPPLGPVAITVRGRKYYLSLGPVPSWRPADESENPPPEGLENRRSRASGPPATPKS